MPTGGRQKCTDGYFGIVGDDYLDLKANQVEMSIGEYKSQSACARNLTMRSIYDIPFQQKAL